MTPEQIAELKDIKEQAAKNLSEHKAFVESANATIATQADIIKNLTDKVATLENTLTQYDTPEDVTTVLGDIKDLLKQADDVIADSTAPTSDPVV